MAIHDHPSRPSVTKVIDVHHMLAKSAYATFMRDASGHDSPSWQQTHCRRQR